jgi:hypothetical protein
VSGFVYKQRIYRLDFGDDDGGRGGDLPVHNVLSAVCCMQSLPTVWLGDTESGISTT